jgi:hypothetical protein
MCASQNHEVEMTAMGLSFVSFEVSLSLLGNYVWFWFICTLRMSKIDRKSVLIIFDTFDWARVISSSVSNSDVFQILV